MANKHATLAALFTDIADAIREKTGDTASIVADDFPDVIRERLQMIPRVKLISFTMDGKSYQAEEGMTWGEWINSEYASSEQTRQCPSCRATESLGVHKFGFVASGTGIGWMASKGCERAIKRRGSPTPESSSNKIETSPTDYITSYACND